jgi:2-polyprenyl-3-methyl-5-hydroxy-6-metoxy-1,4-benzoquinol methylase
MSELENDKHNQGARQIWDAAAAHFDDEPDHGLRDPQVRQAWLELLQESLPIRGGKVLDVGCGTGSLSILLASLSFDVIGIDISPAMIALAQAKAAHSRHNIQFQVMDAASLDFPSGHFDAIICRHLLWTLKQPVEVLERWAKLLSPTGCLILIEGYWYTGGGLHAEELAAMLLTSLKHMTITDLSDQPALWGSPVTDERYLIKGQK